MKSHTHVILDISWRMESHRKHISVTHQECGMTLNQLASVCSVVSRVTADDIILIV